MRIRALVAAVLACLAFTVAGADDPGARAQQLLDDLHRHGQFLKPDGVGTPAVSGAVAYHGQVVFSGGAGFIDLENSVPAAGSSVYNIGSVSKVITAIAVMQLVEAQKVGLDDDIRTWVPEFPDKGAKITIRNLLTHTSGIRHYRRTDFPGTPDNENIQPSFGWLEGVRMVGRDPLLFAPGRYYFYSSYGVNLLQGVVEKASGRTFEQYMREHVWTPAGAASGSVDVAERVVPHRARSYRIVDGRPLNYYYNDLHYKFASGGMIASVEDLVRVGVALNHGRLMSPRTRAELLKPQIPGLQRFSENGAPGELDFQQAMLWRIQKDAEGRTFAYGCGSVKGFNACLIDYVDEDLVAALATNSEECCGWKATLRLADFFRRPKTSRLMPHADAAVFLRTARSSITSNPHTATGADGSYLFNAVAPGKQHLTVLAGGYVIPEAVEFTTKEGDAPHQVDVALDSGAPRSLRVETYEGRPAAGAELDAVVNGEIRAIASTDAAGRVTVPLPLHGEAKIYVIPRDGSFAVVSPRDPDRVTLPRPASSLRIVARTTDGAPLPSVELLMSFNGAVVPPMIARRIGVVQGLKLMTNADGEVVLHNIPSGWYQFWPYRGDEEAQVILDARCRTHRSR